MDLSFIIMQFLSGLTAATLLFLVASGLTLIFGVGNVFNFAHGSFYMIGAYLAYQAVSAWHTHFWTAILVAALGAGILGMLAESLFLRRIYGRAEEGGFQILLTYSFILVIDDLAVRLNTGVTQRQRAVIVGSHRPEDDGRIPQQYAGNLAR